ncbi:hypothetical protein Ancab_029934 [Ancistrocladus abbreviatus]
MAPLNHQKANQAKPKKKVNCFLGCFGFFGEKKKAKTAGGVPGRKKYFQLTWPKFRIMKKSAKNAAAVSKSSSHEGKTQRCINRGELPVKPNQTLPVAEVARAVHLRRKDGIGIHLESEARVVDQQLVSRKGREREELAGSVESNNKTAAGSVQKSRAKVKKRSVDGGDAMIGLSIVVVALLILLIGGRLCAILCTSAWVFCIPRLVRKAVQSNKEDANSEIQSLELNSESYKKKIVLKGLLQRDHRISFVIGS